ncbi:site-specific integrase [Candidatus Enterovibrio escicola]|uniref:integrase n=1 Tax=Candidatus Enterovibrio escicola TaxID=1927127 RepID=UPI001CC25B23|nr:integrase [Candidatus Enterovibrio escacola]
MSTFADAVHQRRGKKPYLGKVRKPKEKKQRQRLTLDEYRAIWIVSPSWLRTAMDLALETTHAVNEICSVRYTDVQLLAEPVSEGGLLVSGYLRIHRQKVQHKEASRVVIPVTPSLFKIINESHDNVRYKYVVHRMPSRISNEVSKHCDHLTQINRKYLIRAFSKYLNLAGVKKKVAAECRLTFHEIRALAIHLYDNAGHDPHKPALLTPMLRAQKYTKMGTLSGCKSPLQR